MTASSLGILEDVWRRYRDGRLAGVPVLQRAAFPGVERRDAQLPGPVASACVSLPGPQHPLERLHPPHGPPHRHRRVSLPRQPLLHLRRGHRLRRSAALHHPSRHGHFPMAPDEDETSPTEEDVRAVQAHLPAGQEHARGGAL